MKKPKYSEETEIQVDYIEAFIDCPTGRFLLFQGKYNIDFMIENNTGNYHTESVERNGVFKIDTSTGLVWYYLSGFDLKKEPMEGWILITNRNITN